ncbi:hypothetical protein [Streptomyces cyaneofuscatus]|uniref:hypothetical protein n=1 Tax=Streptomyces cyaneofuscatus TaxID=66883 RepID=UPI0036D7E8CB
MTDTSMTPDRERMIRIWHEELHRLTDPTAVARREALGDLLAEVDRLRGEVSDATGRVDFLERNTLPDLNRQIEHHKDGKARWRKRAEAAELEAARPSRFSATPAQIDTFLRATLAEDTYLSFQQAIGAHVLEEAVEDAGTVRASADNDGLYNPDWREGWDDAIERVDPDRNGPCPTRLIEFEATP